MGTPLLVEYYNELPNPREFHAQKRAARVRNALETFKQKVAARYSEGTLHRLLESPEVRARRAAVLALGLLGTLERSNAAVAAMLHDGDRVVRQLAEEALWSLWFGADLEANNQELQRLVALRDVAEKRAGLDGLIIRAPQFAEAYNQRAILYWSLGEWQKAVADCDKVLKLNPYHFGASSGMGQCYLQLGKARAALKAFRNALRLNPTLKGLEQTIRSLESTLGEEGRRDDKK